MKDTYKETEHFCSYVLLFSRAVYEMGRSCHSVMGMPGNYSLLMEAVCCLLQPSHGNYDIGNHKQLTIKDALEG